MKLYRFQQLTRQDLHAHIYSKALHENVRALKKLCKPKTKFCAVVKANAYGHGTQEVVNILKTADVDFFAVANIYAALQIATMIETHPILVFEPLTPYHAPDIICACAEKNIHRSVSSLQAVEHVKQTLAQSSHILQLHLNVDTGMARAGVAIEHAAKIIDSIDNCPNTNLAGLSTHFATADEEDLSFAYQQLDTFNNFLADLKLRERKDLIIHAANSAATVNIPESHFDMVRCGISLYGYHSRPMKNPPVTLTPAMKVQAPIVAIKNIPPDTSLSYGRSFTTARKTKTALIPLGYADGYWRCFSNQAEMKVGQSYAPVIGRVCMDQLLIDITDIPDARIGQMVTVIDSNPNSPCSPYALAKIAKTIPYEILTSVGPHLERIVH